MNIIPGTLDGIRIIEPDTFPDDRGGLTKIFHKAVFAEHGMNTTFEESYYSTSKKDVIRGMHFQIPPHDHIKLVYVPQGKIMDVVVDIRKGSPTYGKFETFELSAENHKMIYIPSGFAHGFVSLEDDSQVVYLQSTMRSADHEGGISYDSFGVDWNVENPIVSKRDQTFQKLADYQTPFTYKK
jgi:dTDP-4-dehydrorhamnose 3,5-epimerase